MFVNYFLLELVNNRLYGSIRLRWTGTILEMQFELKYLQVNLEIFVLLKGNLHPVKALKAI